MRIAMLTNTFLPHVGGVAHSVQLFSEQLRNLGHEVLVVCPEFEGAPAKEDNIIRIPAIQKFNGSDFSVVLPVPADLRDRLAQFKPDIFHSHHPFLLGGTALRLAGEMERPIVFTHHTMYEQYTHYVPADSEAMQRFVVELVTGYSNLCNAVIAPSATIAETVRSRGVEVPVQVIPTGVEKNRFKPGSARPFRKKLQIPAEAFVVGHVGRIAAEKNLLFLIESVSSFLRSNPQAIFLVVGDGPELEKIKKQAADAGLEGQFRFAGSRTGNELVQAYRAMDLFAFSSKSETQGMVLIEAMACGVPVVGLDAPGVRDVIADGTNGTLVREEDAESFSSALDYFVKLEPSKLEECSAAAEKTADEFSLERSCTKIVELYSSLRPPKYKGRKVEESTWWRALHRVEAEWALWSNIADSLSKTVLPPEARKQLTLRSAWRELKRISRKYNRLEWFLKQFKLSAVENHDRVEKTPQPGLILIQVDGLSRTQFERAISRRKLPFLQRLISIEGYVLQSLYAGLPSTTPAVQAELFYGEKCAVPAFAFLDRSAGNQAVRLYQASPAQKVEANLQNHAQGLLKEGSCYSNIYSGGATESHYCAVSAGWNKLFGTSNPFRIALAATIYLPTTIRIFGLVLLELLIGGIEFFRGIFQRRPAFEEFLFLLSRTLVGVILRKIVTLAACIDAGRGIPVIHVNYLGYDEHAHRRGPASNFAHWCLKGIDCEIRRIWTAAVKSRRRDYAIWIYSDHGQESAVGYHEVTGKLIEHTVAEIWEKSGRLTARPRMVGQSAQTFRLSLFGKWLQRLLGTDSDDKRDNDQGIAVAAVGPVGHIYLPKDADRTDLDSFCRALSRDGQIPIVLRELPRDSNGRKVVKAWTERGEFLLPRDTAKLIGPSHEFLHLIRGDLIALVEHPNAGDIIILGWRPEGTPITFAIEKGAHAGPGREETRGFLLLPPTAPPPPKDRTYLRPLELRELALEALGRSVPDVSIRMRPKVERAPEVLRVMTYNVHSCIGVDGRLSIKRIAQVINQYSPDVVCLQELDVDRKRTGRRDQAQEIAYLLQMICKFHPAFTVEEEKYGDAILSRYPIQLIKAGRLPQKARKRGERQPRGALLVEVDTPKEKVLVLNTHLGLHPLERRLQIDAILGKDWLGNAATDSRVIVCGDLNASPGSYVCKTLRQRYQDVQTGTKIRPQKTWHGRVLINRIDHIFISPNLKVRHVSVPRTALTKTASDHLPVIADIDISENSSRSAAAPATNPVLTTATAGAAGKNKPSELSARSDG
jgi:glycosyltransferase involved in cell wall biosynthesis/endonuclease/exonuclease/phosphatase family metal-dependent hydrolase